MEKKYYFISVFIRIDDGDRHYYNEVIDMTPSEYVKYHKELGGDYQNRMIMYAEEITKGQFEEYKDFINEQ